MITTGVQQLISAITATGNSGWIKVGAAQKISMIVKRANHTSGSSTFTVDVAANASGDGSTAYSKIIDNATNTNAQNYTRIASKALSSNTTAFLTLDPADAIAYIKITATIATDGDASVWLITEYQ